MFCPASNERYHHLLLTLGWPYAPYPSSCPNPLLTPGWPYARPTHHRGLGAHVTQLRAPTASMQCIAFYRYLFFCTAAARWACPSGLSIVGEQEHVQCGAVPRRQQHDASFFFNLFFCAAARWAYPLVSSIVEEQGHVQRGNLPQLRQRIRLEQRWGAGAGATR